jgi:hypothetical protein
MRASLAIDPSPTVFLFMNFEMGVVPHLGERAGDVVARARPK